LDTKRLRFMVEEVVEKGKGVVEKGKGVAPIEINLELISI
jgi:hypothetical protein